MSGATRSQDEARTTIAYAQGMHETLRDLRRQRGITQAQIGAELNLSKASVSRMEAGLNPITIVQAQRWATLCGARLLIVMPEHEAVMEEVSLIPPSRATLALRFLRLLPTLHTLRLADFEGLLRSWEQISGSVAADFVKSASRE